MNHKYTVCRDVIFALATLFIFAFTIKAYSQDLKLGKKYFDEKKFDEAFAEYSKFKKNSSEYAESQYYLGLISMRKKDYEKSEVFLKQAISVNGNIADYHLALGSLYGQMAAEANVLRQALLAPKIRDSFEKAAKLDPKSLNPRWMLIAYHIRAPKIMGGDLAKGKIIADEIMKINQAEGNRAWGMIYQAEEENDLAEKSYRSALNQSPDSIVYHFALARFFESVSKSDLALDTYQKIVNKFPENRNALLNFGRVTANLSKNVDEGEKSLQKFIKLTANKDDKSLANAYYYLGMIEKNKGNKANAKKYFELALKINPEHKQTKEIIKTL